MHSCPSCVVLDNYYTTVYPRYNFVRYVVIAVECCDVCDGNLKLSNWECDQLGSLGTEFCTSVLLLGIIL